MFERFGLKRKLSQDEEIKNSLKKAEKICNELIGHSLKPLDISGYNYTADEAIEELGLDDGLVHQLVEDYVIQILKSKSVFHNHIEDLKKARQENTILDYTPLRELAHKNLGVARNLRIKDAQKILDELMTKDDLEYLSVCLEVLEACAIKLKPKCAYNTMKLIEIKNSI
ncbi:hypothetical protein KJ877_03805 [bacterium]|nr:hypothetical protein [bacterium]MBU1989177.1 hypothetical protein [bacterium]